MITNSNLLILTSMKPDVVDPLIFQTKKFFISVIVGNIKGLSHQVATCNDIKIRKIGFVINAHLLYDLNLFELTKTPQPVYEYITVPKTTFIWLIKSLV